MELLSKLGIRKKNLRPAASKMFAFNGKQAKCLGVLKVGHRNMYYSREGEVSIFLQVTDNLLLSLEACKALGYVREEFPEVIEPSW